MTKNSITLSSKYGVNPSVLRCICCGKDYGVAMLGKLKGDKEAPREIFQGLCNDCEGVVKHGGAMIIEVVDGETCNNPCRTGRLVGVSKDFKERNHIEHSIMYMPRYLFSKVFGEVNFSKQ